MGGMIKFAALLITFAVMTAGAEEPRDWNYYYKIATEKRYKGDYDGAIADFDAALKLAPNIPEIYNARGIAYEKSGDYEAAMVNYEYALHLNPNSAEALHNIRHLNARFGDSGSLPARNAATPASGQNAYGGYEVPDGYGSYGGYDGYGEYGSYGENGSYGEYGGYGEYESYGEYGGYRQYEDYGVAPSVQTDPYSRRGVVSFFPEQGEAGGPASQPVRNESYGQTAAAPILEQGARESGAAVPSERVDVNRTPIVIQRNGAAQTALNSQSYSPAAGSGTITVFAGGGDAPGRLRDGRFFQQAPLSAVRNTAERDGKAPYTPENKVNPVAEIYNNYGAALYGQGLYDEAVLQFNEAIKIYPNYAIAYNNRGLAFAEKGDLARAAADFDQALRINPYYYDAQFNRSLLLKARQR
jgi:Tfp pilus assembly protein PilF